jgi:mono/diheme cytochrome c family protein
MKRVAACLVCASALVAACDRPPSTEGLKEWTPTDHDGEKKTGATNQGPKGDAGGTPALVEITWRNQCATCHGAVGKADGPQAAMFKPADLSKDDWQAKVNDDEIAATIKNGKGRMPKFDLSEEVVRGLVSRIRSFRGK